MWYHDQYLPVYYEVNATVTVVKPTAGWKANAYVIYDYASPTDFKFAGVNVATNKIEMGHRTEAGWIVDKQSAAPVQLKAGQSYNVLVAVNGTNVSVLVDSGAYLTYTYAPRVIDGVSYALNKGMLGVGSDRSRGTYDNVKLQVLPATITYQATETFASGDGPLFGDTTTGTWTTSGGRYGATPPSAQEPATSLAWIGVDSLQPGSNLDLSVKLATQGRAGFVFDWYGPTDYKFVALDQASDQVLVGHRTARGWVIDATVARIVDAGTDYTLAMTIRNTTVTVSVDGQVALSFSYNGVPVDGRFGLFTLGSAGAFYDFSVQTNDPSFATAAAASTLLLASGEPDGRSTGAPLTQATLQPLFEEALRRWAATLDAAQLAALRSVDVVIADLPGDALGRYEDGVITIDVDAAGHGWFIDHTPGDDREFAAGDGTLVARNGEAAGDIDLLSVLAHELGHAAGLAHEGSAVMGEQLADGVRTLPAVQDAPLVLPPTASPVAVAAVPPDAGRPDDVPVGLGDLLTGALVTPAPLVVWDTPAATLASVPQGAAAAAAPAWVTDFVSHLGRSEGERNPNAGLRVTVPVAARASAEVRPSLGALHRT